MTWRVDREVAVLLGSGSRALLMQVAHPLIAAGVADHSRYRTDPVGRLRHTIEAIYAFAFADAERATEVVRSITQRHARVKGTAPSGVPYSALDPDLLLWVYATLIDSSLLAYDTFVTRLCEAECETYYAEFRRAGPLWGIPPERFPDSLRVLRAWMSDLIDGGEVRVTEQGREIGRDILEPRWMPAPLAWPLKITTLWLLPPTLRSGFYPGFAWGPRQEAAMRCVAALSRAVVPHLPSILRDLPVARQAERRVRRYAAAI